MKTEAQQPRPVNCPQCKKEIVLEEIKRIYGSESNVYIHKFCSAKCFTEHITKEPEPQHTQGELKHLESQPKKVYDNNDFCIALCDSRETAKRIVMAVNSHDDLLRALKYLFIIAQEGNWMQEDRGKEIKSIIDKAESK